MKNYKPKGNKIGERLYIYTILNGVENIQSEIIQYNPSHTFEQFLDNLQNKENYTKILASCALIKEEQEYFQNKDRCLIKEFIHSQNVIDNTYWRYSKIPKLLIEKIKTW